MGTQDDRHSEIIYSRLQALQIALPDAGSEVQSGLPVTVLCWWAHAQQHPVSWQPRLQPQPDSCCCCNPLLHAHLVCHLGVPRCSRCLRCQHTALVAPPGNLCRLQPAMIACLTACLCVSLAAYLQPLLAAYLTVCLAAWQAAVLAHEAIQQKLWACPAVR